MKLTTISKKTKQARSERTKARLLDATSRLLKSHDFESITIADIVREARSSVGGFYARFQDKTALLVALYERYDQKLYEEHCEIDPDTDGLEDLALESCRRIVDDFHKNRWFLRAMFMYARTNVSYINDGIRERRATLHRRLAEPFTRHANRIAHNDPIRAAEWGLFVVTALVREKVLFGEAPHAASIVKSNEELVIELARTLIAYLQAAPPLLNSHLQPNKE